MSSLNNVNLYYSSYIFQPNGKNVNFKTKKKCVTINTILFQYPDALYIKKENIFFFFLTKSLSDGNYPSLEIEHVTGFMYSRSYKRHQEEQLHAEVKLKSYELDI